MDIRSIKLAVLSVLSVSFFLCNGQVKKITNVYGSASISNISPEQAKLKAIDAAKAEALRLAGVEEWVQSFDYLDKKEVNKKYSEFFYSITSVQSMGNVIGWQLVKEQKKIDVLNNLLYEVYIDAEVKLYKTRSDPEFRVDVTGLKPVYNNEENLKFQVRPAKEGFLHVFALDEQSMVVKLFPNNHEKENKLAPLATYNFPLSPHFNYEVFTDHKEEQNYIIFLYTRQNIEFTKTSFEDFIQYVYTIEPWERSLSMEKILIVRNSVAADH